MVQKERKSGHWQVERLQFLKREQRGLRLRYAVIDLQPCDLQTAKFFCLLHNKGTLIFQIKRPLFLEKRPDLSLPTDVVAVGDEPVKVARVLRDTFERAQGVTDH